MFSNRHHIQENVPVYNKLAAPCCYSIFLFLSCVFVSFKWGAFTKVLIAVVWVPHHSYRCCIKALKFLHFSPFIFMCCIDAWKPFIPFYVFFLNTRASHQNVVFFSQLRRTTIFWRFADHVSQNNKVIKRFPQAMSQAKTENETLKANFVKYVQGKNRIPGM